MLPIPPRKRPDRSWRKKLLVEIERLLIGKITLDHKCSLIWIRSRLEERVKNGAR
jgi:hypothetical protein